jgi:hypothetical protein
MGQHDSSGMHLTLATCTGRSDDLGISHLLAAYCDATSSTPPSMPPTGTCCRWLRLRMLPQQVLSQDNSDKLLEEASSHRRWSKAVFRDQSVCNAAACRGGLVSCSCLKRGRQPLLDRHARGQEIADRSLRTLPDLHLTADDRLHEGPDLRVGIGATTAVFPTRSLRQSSADALHMYFNARIFIVASDTRSPRRNPNDKARA